MIWHLWEWPFKQETTYLFFSQEHQFITVVSQWYKPLQSCDWVELFQRCALNSALHLPLIACSVIYFPDDDWTALLRYPVWAEPHKWWLADTNLKRWMLSVFKTFVHLPSCTRFIDQDSSLQVLEKVSPFIFTIKCKLFTSQTFDVMLLGLSLHMLICIECTQLDFKAWVVFCSDPLRQRRDCETSLCTCKLLTKILSYHQILTQCL